jgi:hypothetical protein
MGIGGGTMEVTDLRESKSLKQKKSFKEIVLAASEQFKKPKVYIPALLLVIALPIAGSQLYRYTKGSRLDNANTKQSGVGGFLKPVKESDVKLAVSPLDGLKYPEDVANRHTLGVMIENHPDSRPQAGLSEAGVVYEAQAEGGITRFLALFGPKSPAKAGPVRSARTYYLDWCLEYDCFYSHVGGNIDALDLIPKIKIKDLDQFSLGTKAYAREPKKGIAIEHTMYAYPAKLYAIATEKGWSQTGGQASVNFKEDGATTGRPAAQQINIAISSAQFNTSWAYDPTTNTYARSMGGAIHKDANTGEQIKSKVLIVQEVAAKPILTRINEQGLAMITVGTGKAKIMQDGIVTEGTWKKSSQSSRTIFMDAAGQEVKFNAGQRWITVVDPGSAVTVTTTTATPSPSPTK